MILPFSTQLNGKPTYFPEKILASLIDNKIIYELEFINLIKGETIQKIGKVQQNKDGIFIKGNIYKISFDNTLSHTPKLHTIREDKNDRWKSGVMIDFFINCRQPNMFRFAPRIPVVSTQTVYMSYAFNDLIEISVGHKELFGYAERLQFAQNDGFDTWEKFFDYFYPMIKATPNNFLKRKLIHWTDKRY